MTPEEKNAVSTIVDGSLREVLPDAHERGCVLDAILPDIVADIELTADRQFGLCDICIALSRVLAKRLTAAA